MDQEQNNTPEDFRTKEAPANAGDAPYADVEPPVGFPPPPPPGYGPVPQGTPFIPPAGPQYIPVPGSQPPQGAVPPAYGYVPQGQYVPTPPYGYPPPKKPQGMGIAAMVLGICSIVFCWLTFIGLAVGVVGLVLGIISYKRDRSNGFSLAGIITSSVGILLGILILVLIASIFGWTMNTLFNSSYSGTWY